MRHRHIHAKKGEWIHIHRDNNDPGCLGVLIVIFVIGILLNGC